MTNHRYFVVIRRKISRVVEVAAPSAAAARKVVNEYGLDSAFEDFPQVETLQRTEHRIMSVLKI
jgi:hypothetical protein